MNANTRAVVDRMFTDEKVALNVWVNDDIHSIAEALMADNVRVKQLTLSVPVSIEDAEKLRDALSVNTSVNELILPYIDADCLVTLAQGMAVQQNVKKLSLYRVHIDTEEDLTTFQAALRLIAPFVEDFILGETTLGDTGARVLAEILRDGNSFSKLEVNDCDIGSTGAAHLAGALRVNSSLQELKLSNTYIKNDGVIALAEGLMNNKNITVLHLMACGFSGSEGVAAVVRLLEANATIEELDISSNNIGDAGCIALVKGLLRNQGLRVLNLGLCQVANDGVKQIGRTLKTNSHLERLVLLGNDITEEGLEALLDGLSCNTTLLEMATLHTYVHDDFILPVPLTSRIEVYLAANRFLRRYRSREPATVSPFLLSIMLAQVSNHPAVHYLLTREHIPDLLASSTAIN
jgi:hypothetical protein